MPVERCRRDGKPGYRWGQEGKCYVYTPGNEASRKRAKEKAREQGQAIKAETQNFTLSGSLHHMASEDIMAFVDPARLEEIRKTDPHPYIAAFTIAHEGVAKPKQVGGEVMLLKYFKDAIKSIYDNLKLGTRVFLGHDEKNDPTRPAIGEVVGKSMRTIGGKLHDIAAVYLSPETKDRERLDVASIEAEIEFLTGEGGLEAVGTRGVHGIALGNSQENTPAFDGAKLLAAIAAFSKEGTMTKDEVLERIAESGWTPSELFPEDVLFKDDVVSRKVNQTGYEAARRVRNEEVAELQKTLNETQEQLANAQREALAGKSGSMLDSILTDLEVSDDKMKKFIDRRMKQFTPEAKTEEELSEALKTFVKDSKNEFLEYQEIFNGSKPEPEPAEAPPAAPAEKPPAEAGTPPGDYVSGTGNGFDTPETNEFIPT